MSVTGRTFHGVAWAATSGWVQLGVSLLTFGVIAQRLSPVEIGSFGVVTLVVGLTEIATGGPLAESLQQRRTLDPEHANATFWLGLMLSVLAAAVMAWFAPSIAQAFSAPAAAKLLLWGLLGLPIAAATSVPTALLARMLRFDEIARTGAIAGVLAGLVGIGAIFAGAGVWSLLLSDFSARFYRLGRLWYASGYRPGRLRRLGAIAELMRFNLNTLATHLLGYADRAAPRLLAGALLGAAPLGYLIIAQRVLDLLSQLVLSPLNSVTMAAVARVQDNRAELRRLILSLYRLASICAYPAFLGAIVLVPDLARLFGEKWLPAVLATQILLAVGLRTTSGMFNISILRGVGHSGAPLILLSAGLALILLLVPLCVRFGPAGVATAVLLRTLATWPLGCWLVKRATDIAIHDQARVGASSFAAGLATAIGIAVVLATIPAEPPLSRLIFGVLLGSTLYVALLAAFAQDVRQAMLTAVRMIFRGEKAIALQHIRAGFGY